MNTQLTIAIKMVSAAMVRSGMSAFSDVANAAIVTSRATLITTRRVLQEGWEKHKISVVVTIPVVVARVDYTCAIY